MAELGEGRVRAVRIEVDALGTAMTNQYQLHVASVVLGVHETDVV